jgi:hypothetical protein
LVNLSLVRRVLLFHLTLLSSMRLLSNLQGFAFLFVLVLPNLLLVLYTLNLATSLLLDLGTSRLYRRP